MMPFFVLKPPLMIQLKLDGATVPFEVNNGANVTIISQRTKQKFLPRVCLKSSQVTLLTYTAQPMKVLEELYFNVKYGMYDGTHIYTNCLWLRSLAQI